MRIQIQLASRDVGTTALVTRRRWFRKVSETFSCFKADPVRGGSWINAATGLRADLNLEYQLNDAANAAALLYRITK